MTSQKPKKFISVLVVLTMVLALLPASLGLAASYDSIGEFVKNVYEVGLGREADVDGYNYWVSELESGNKTAAQFVGFVLLDSAEFNEKYADISNEEFVEKAYEIIFNREADEEGAAFWVDSMKRGGSQKYVLVAMMYAPTGEFQEFCDAVGVKLGNIRLADTEFPGDEPVELEVVDVSAINLKQILVEYNKDIDEADEAAKKDNYKLVDSSDDEIALSNINVEGENVILTIEDGKEVKNQSEATLTVKKAVTGEEVEENIDFIDLTIPKVTGAEVIGEDTIKVYFSEPIDVADKDDFDIEDGDYFIEDIEFVNNRTEINVKTYASFDEDSIEIEVGSGIEDFAGLNILSKTFEVEVPDDKEAPYVYEYKDASKTGVTLVFNEDIALDSDYDKEDFYHTNDNNTVDEDGVELNGAELKLSFADAPLPEGTAYVYVSGGIVRDLFGNVQKNVLKVAVEVVPDETAPTIKEVKADSQSKLTVTFSEAVDEGAETEGNYTILNSDGKEVEDIIKKAEQTDDDEVVIKLDDDLDYGKYTLVVEGVADLSANKANDSYEFDVDDNDAPEFPTEAALYTVDEDDDVYKLVIKFDEAMTVDGQYSVLNLANYKFDGGDYFDELNDDSDIEVSAKAVDSNKTVEITFDGYEVTTSDEIIMGRVADAAGNKTEDLKSDPIDIKKGSYVGFKSAKATARDTIVVQFDDSFKDFDKDDLEVRYGNEEITITKVKTLSASKVQLTLKKNLDYTAKYDDEDVYVVVVDDESINKYKSTLLIGDKVKVSDSIAPALATTEVNDEDVDKVLAHEDENVVALYFTEDINPKTVSLVSFKVEDVTVTDAYAVDNVVYLLLNKAAAVGADVTQKAVIKDANGNEVSDIDTEIADDDDFDIPKKPEDSEEPGEEPEPEVTANYIKSSDILENFGWVQIEVENLDDAATFSVSYELADGTPKTTEKVSIDSKSKAIVFNETVVVTIYDAEGAPIYIETVTLSK